MARQGRIYADFADSQWYAEPKRLDKLGYLSSTQEAGPHARSARATRSPTRGARRCANGCDEPSPFSRIQLEPAWRLLAADVAGDEAVLESLRPLRAEIARPARADRRRAADRAATLPRRERYLMLNHRLARRIVDAHADWLDEVEQELGELVPGFGDYARFRRSPITA